MNKQQAIEIVCNTFESPFNRENYANFIGRLLNQMEPDPFTYTGQYIPHAFSATVSKYERLGKYEDSDGKRVDILIVYLQRESSVERARATQRRFIAGYLQGNYGSKAEKDAALVAFVSLESLDDWRFSLVKLETQLEITAKGGIKAVDEFTPARRWSFLVGHYEKSHTAQTQFVPIMQDTDHNPTLTQLEEAFNIEKVTKEFFEKYRDLFIRTKAELDKAVAANPKVVADFAANGVDTVNFAKKLLGQIIFLYYLQKKGWFGVPRDGKWGEGSKQFLRELFEGKHSDYANFFNDILEPLFYEALRNDRSHEDHYYRLFNCKIPFLNGGLFDPMGGYGWVNADILLSNDLFSNQNKTKEGDVGDGILDIFDRYNFTVKEDEPFEKEVAIDPELLGKAYEKFNAIRPDNYDEFVQALSSGKKGEESKFNKQYGVYYTPREIVHYMCRQSLIHYLVTALEGKVSQEDLALLIEQGEDWRENDARVISKERETETYAFLSSAAVRQYASEIDEKLAVITVCDPAVGSGAFPVGMMSEIVRARETLTTYLLERANRSIYGFKRACIERSLYGVDIDAGAVEIAKLRLWLSLIVDEEDIKQIKPLPNLDYKIVQGNSLIEMLGGDFLVVTADAERANLIKALKLAKDDLFNLTSPSQKKQKKIEIEGLIYALFENYRLSQITGLEEQVQRFKGTVGFAGIVNMVGNKREQKKVRELEGEIKALQNLKMPAKTDHFEWQLNFSEIYQSKGGFDVMIANPPYGANLSEEHKKYLKNRHDNIVERIRNTFLYFLGEAYNQINSKGTICFILPNELLFQIYMTKARRFFLENSQILFAINLGEDVFDAIVPTCVVALAKSNQETYSIPVADMREAALGDLPQLLVTQNFAKTTNQKILTAPNNMFSFDGLKSELINRLTADFEPFENFCENIANGISTSCDEIYIVTEEFALANKFEKEYLKECIRGGQFNRFYCPEQTHEYVLYITKAFDPKKGKNIYQYLSKNN